jgi:hypothetical protein
MRPNQSGSTPLMRRAFGLDVLRCPRCAGRMQVMAAIDGPAVIQRILANLGLPGARAGPPSQSVGSAVRTKQPPLPDLTLKPVPGARATAAVRVERPGLSLAASRLRFDLSRAL